MHGENVVYVTKEGLEDMKQELEYLKTVKRAEVSERLERAISQGDISENADYDYAKQEQAFLEGRIMDLEDSLRRAKLIEEGGGVDSVRVGSTVTVAENGYDEKETYRIVGVHEASPADGLISNESPLGKALLGAKVGDVVEVKTPGGGMEFRIQEIS